MSSAPTDESGAAAASRTPTAPPRPKRRRLRRWLVWLALIAIALRITLEFTLHHVVTYGIGLAGLAGECRGASLSLLGGAVRLRGVTLADPDAGKGERGMQLRVEEIAADVSTWQLLRGELVLTDAVLRDVDLRLHRRSDGAIELPDAWQGSGGAEPEPEPEPEAGGPPDFELPLSIVTARIDDLHVHLTEADPERPPLDLVVALDADDVGRRDVPGRLALRIGTPELPNRLVLDARIETPPHRLACSLSLSANGLDLARLLPAAAGIEPLSLTLAIGVEAGAAENEPDGRHLAIAAELQRAPGFARKFVARFDGTFHADGSSALRADLDADAVALRPLAALLRDAGVALAPDGVDLAAAATASLPANAEGPIALQLTGVRLAHGDDAVELGEMAIDGLRLGDAGCEVDSVRIVGPTAQVVKDLDGSLAIAGLTLLPTAASAPDAAPDAPTTPSTPATATAPGAPAAAPALPTVLVQSLDWRGTALSFADRSQAGSDPLEVRDLTLTGSGLACACDREPGTATLALSVPGIAETVTADLRLQPQQHGGMLEIEFVGDGITLARLQPWLAPAGIAPAFETARLAFGLHAEVGGEKAPEHLRARLADLRFTAGDTVLASLRNAELRELRLDRPKLAFDALDVLEPVVRLERSATATTVAGLRFGEA
ncbi:MAG: DUF748 domain-containing protein, partial [Planctomycetes bacterium]|nr:DUF748 domain-containing protein [Planctomycetota bacterium]